MKDHIDLFEEENGSVTVEIDLQHYLPLFLRANGHGAPLRGEETNEFNHIFADFTEHFAGVGAENLMDDIKTYLLQKYTAEEQMALQASPAFNLINDAYTEICKNAIDAFLEHHMKNPNDPSHTVKLNINLEQFFDEVSISFSDAGPGFPPPMQDALNTEEKQLAYSETHQGSQKRTGGSAGYIGMMGKGGRGLRNIIALVLSGEPLHPGHKVQRAPHFDSAIHFSNDSNPYCRGACIDITTQIAPIPEVVHLQDLRGMPRKSETSVRESTDSDSSRSAYSPSYSDNPIEQKATSGMSKLSLIIESNEEDQLFGDSPIGKPKPDSKLTLAIDGDFLQDSSRFQGNSPEIPQKRHPSRLKVAHDTDSSDFSSTSSESPTNVSIEATNPVSAHQSSRLSKSLHIMPVKPNRWSPNQGRRMDAQPFAKSTIHDARQSWPSTEDKQSTRKKQSEFKGKMLAQSGDIQKTAPGIPSKKSFRK